MKFLFILILTGLSLNAFCLKKKPVHKSNAATQDSGDWTKDSRAKIRKIIQKSGESEKHFGIFISEGHEGGEEIFELNSNKKMIPASITKIATAAMVLNEFPPGTKFKTQLLSDGKIEKETLKGDLFLKGGGDPSFVSENLWFLVNSFLRTGVKRIDGHIFVDDSYFDDLRFDPSRQNVRVDRAYDAPIGAMSFNWNSVNIFVRPGGRAGEFATTYSDPENDYIELSSQVKTVAGANSDIQVDRIELANGTKDRILVKGQIGVDSKEIVIYKNITRPDIWAGSNLKSFLHQRGIEVTGIVKAQTTPANARLLAESESKPIEHILADMNKFSNNYVAEMLAKLAAAKTNPPGTILKAMDKTKNFLIQLGIPRDSFEIKNPSGLTRDNQVTAKSLWLVLKEMNSQFQFQPEFFSSLPIAGVDGTLKKRMKETKGERWVRAKTGFLTGVVSLAGYVGRKNGDVIPFVMMYNGSHDEGQIRSTFDQICLALVEP